MADPSYANNRPVHRPIFSVAETSSADQYFEDVSLGNSSMDGEGNANMRDSLAPTVLSRTGSPAETGNPADSALLGKERPGKGLVPSVPQPPGYVMSTSQRRAANQVFTLFMDAVLEGDAHEIQTLLQRGVDISRPGSDGLTALHHAAMNGHLRIVHLLLKRSAPILAATPRGYTPLALAANGGHLAVVEYLIHAQHDCAPQAGNQPVSPAKPVVRPSPAIGDAKAVSSDGLDIFDDTANAYKSRTNDDNLNELAHAVKKGSLEGVVRMIAAIASSLVLKETSSRIGTVEEFREELNAHLAHACRDGHVDIVLALLCAGVPVDAPDRLGLTPLMHAVISNQVPTITELLRAGAVLERKDKRGHTPLSLAIDGGHFAVLKALINGKADIWNATAWNDPLIYYAAANRRTEVVRMLLAQRADLLDADGSKALARYARAGSVPAVETLVSAGADPNHRAADGHTAFTLAAANGHEKILAILLNARPGAEWQRNLLTQCDKQGRTALMLAALNDQTEAVKYLLGCHADVQQRDFAGRNALLWAAVKGSAAMMELLVNRGAKRECADDHGDTILTIAAGHNNLAAVNFIIENFDANRQFGIDTPNREGDTALIKAARAGLLDMVRILNYKGANMLAINKEGRTAIHEAAAHGYMDVVSYLQTEIAAMPKVYPYANGALSVLGKLPLVSALLPERVPVRTREFDIDGNSLIMMAAANGRENLLRELFELQFDPNDGGEQGYGLATDTGGNTLALATASPVAAPSSPSKINIEETNREGLTALCQAAQHGQYTAMKFLIEQGARANGTFQARFADKPTTVTPLWLVARRTHCPPGNGTEGNVYKMAYSPEMLVQLLLNNGAESDIDTTCGQWNQTPLLAAAIAGRVEVVKLMLEYGASIGVKDIQGIGPLMYAAWHGHRDVVELLLNNDAGANVKHGELSALILAAENDHADIVQLLVKRGANVDHADSLGTTALIGATRRGKASAVAALIALGANLHHVDLRGNSALFYASRDRNEEIINLLGKGAPPPRNQ